MSEIERHEGITRPKPNWMAGAVFLILGVGLGVGIMAVLNQTTKDPARLASLNPSAMDRIEKPSANRGAEAPSKELPGDTFSLGANAGSGPQAAMPPPTTAADPGAEPTIPTTPPTLPGALSGSLMPEGQVPLKPIVIDGDKPATLPTAYTEFAAPEPGAEGERFAQQIRSVVAAGGGKIHLEFVWESDRPELGRELVVSVPLVQAEKLRAALGKVSGLAESPPWTGSASERHSRVEKFLRDAANRTESRLSNLRLRFHDDAPDVVRAAESLERLQKAMAALKPISADREAIRISIGRGAD